MTHSGAHAEMIGIGLAMAPESRRAVFAARGVASAASGLARDRYEPHTTGRKA